MVKLVVVLTLLTLLAAACDPEPGVGGPTPSPAAPTASHLENFNDAVLTSGSSSAEAGFSGTYTLRATVDGTSIAGVVTWYRMGTRMRADFAGTVAGQDEDAIVVAGPNYPADDLLYVCKSNEQTCVEVHRTASGDDPAALVPSLAAFQLLDVTSLSSGLNFYDQAARTLVEQPVLCFVGRSETTPVGPIDHAEVCLTDDGLPLLVTASGAGRTV